VQDEHREDDGIHWNALSHRWLTNILLSHISAAWGLGWPKYPIASLKDGKTFDGILFNDLRNILLEYAQATNLPPPE
jgi:hypothetical protein